MHLNSELMFRSYAAKYFSEAHVVLEIGPCGFPSHYSKALESRPKQWHTLDLTSDFIEGGQKNPQHIVSASEYHYPIASETYDIVLAGNVMEHVKNIWLWIDELKRITKKDGLIIIVIPVSWPYHAYPVDCWRIYPDGMRALMESKGLSIVECKCESLERTLLPLSTPTIAGSSGFFLDGTVSWKRKILFWYNRIVSSLPLLRNLTIPVTVAYDTICICRKIEDIAVGLSSPAGG